MRPFSLSLTHTNRKSNYLWCGPRYITSALAGDVTLIAVSLEFEKGNSRSHFISTSKRASFVLQQIAAHFWGDFYQHCWRSSLMFAFIFFDRNIMQICKCFLSRSLSLSLSQTHTSLELSFLVLTGLCPSQFPPNFLSISLSVPSCFHPPPVSPSPPSLPPLLSLVAREPEGLEVWITSHV